MLGMSSKALAIAMAATAIYTVSVVAVTIQVAAKDDGYCRQLAEAQAQQKMILENGIKPLPFSATDGHNYQLLKTK